MNTKDGCIKTSSNCVTWNGPDIPCLNLCNGDSVTDVLYKLATKFCETLVLLDPVEYDISCFNYQGVYPAGFPELFQLVIDQICSVQQQTGPQGVPGTNGTNGTNGNYVVVENLSLGNTFCPCGGVEIQTYSGATNTIIDQYYVCSGCNGNTGNAGTAGPKGDPGNPGITGPIGIPGLDGISGRGIAVFVQTSEPTLSDFNALYGTVQGFGVNYITGNNQIKAGDLWIEPCVPPAG